MIDECFLRVDQHINQQINQLDVSFDSKNKFIEFEFLLEEKDWNFLNLKNKFKETDLMVTLYNYLKSQIGNSNKLQIWYFSLETKKKEEIDFGEKGNIKDFLGQVKLPINRKGQFILHYDYSLSKRDPLYLC